MSKIALFGGTFDPIHLGHTSCIQHLVDNMDFSEIIIVPTNLNPLKAETNPASKEDRLKMIQLALGDYEDAITIDETELEQRNPSYTVDTLKRYLKDYKPEELFLVMGIDTFGELDRWKDFAEIIKMANLVVVSRPPFRRPLGIEELPKGLQEHVHTYERGYTLLESGRTIEFVNIKSSDVSSSLVRKKLKSGKSVEVHVNINVEKYIKENNVYPQLIKGDIDFKEFTLFAAAILKERAMNCAGYDLSKLDKLYDFTLVASATSTKQAQSLASILRDALKEEFGINPFGVEGMEEGRWVILDYGAALIHIFYDYVRHEYHLEQLWQAGEKLKI